MTGLDRGISAPLTVTEVGPHGADVLLNVRLPVFVLSPSLPTMSFLAVVDWGDGSRSSDVLAATSLTALNLIGFHTYEPPKAVPVPNAPPPVASPDGGRNSQQPNGAAAFVPPQVVVTAVDTSRTPRTGTDSGQVFVRVSLEGVGEVPSANAPVRINIRLYLPAAPTGFRFDDATVDDVSLVIASTSFFDNSEHLPPVVPIPPGPVGPPWKPSPPEPIPSPHPAGFAAPNALSPLRISSLNVPAAVEPNPPVVVADTGTLRDTTRTTPPGADPRNDPAAEWFKSRARELTLLLQLERDKPVDQPTPPVSLPQWAADDCRPRDRVIRNGLAAERLPSEALPHTGWGTPFQPDALASEPAAGAASAVASIWFGELDATEEAEQEAAAGTVKGQGRPTARAAGVPYRLLLVVGYAVCSVCWFRYGRFPGRPGPAPVGPRREESSNGPIL